MSTIEPTTERIAQLEHLLLTNECTNAFLMVLLRQEELATLRQAGENEYNLNLKQLEINATRSFYYQKCRMSGITPHNVDSIGGVG